MTDIDLIYFRHNVNLAAPKISAMPISFHDLTIVLDGSLEYVIDGERVIINKGDLIFIKKGSVRFREQGKQPSNYISFNFNSNRKINIPLVFKDGVNNITRILIVAYDEITSTPAFDCREKIKYLLSCLILAFEDNKKTQKFSPLTVKIMEYINCNFSNKITLSDIGEQMFFHLFTVILYLRRKQELQS